MRLTTLCIDGRGDVDWGGSGWHFWDGVIDWA